MPPREKKSSEQGGDMSISDSRELQALAWEAADQLRGSMESDQYKDFVLGLIFLKYLSDASDELAEQRTESRNSADRDGHTGVVYRVPQSAHWSWIAANTESQGLGGLLDGAMEAIMRENAALAGALPTGFGRIDPKRLAGLFALVGDARFSGSRGRPARDVLGEVYEYLLDLFAREQGKRGGEFYTPSSVAQLTVALLEPYEGCVYDPACGSGGMLVAADKFVEAHRGRDHRADISVYGQEINEHTWRLGRMNLVVHGMDGDLATRPGNTFALDQHPGLKADFVLTRPPFNVKDWGRDESDPRWRYGVPPKSNANFAWLQHAVSKLTDTGTAAVLLANGSMTSSGTEGEIRRAMVEADLVAGLVALPAQLFQGTAIPACLWLLSKDKSAQGAKGLADRRGQILFVDACGLGEPSDRTGRELTDAHRAKIATVYRAWRGTASAKDAGLRYRDEPGFSFSANIATVREHGYALPPARYVGIKSSPALESTVGLQGGAALMRDLYAIFD
ncbi:type I restriction-modification system subunit M [Streptomyces sp. NRRL F-4428]|uniref:type I restriction-modification system subunit M n=1 Tax=Streptomyces sp. NRRL F-4428 TaxID=1609137 RepID=UPI0005EC6246|nr:type I restriction-modification system subunit M [Streptomyces sp. NRRL F-4428]